MSIGKKIMYTSTQMAIAITSNTLGCVDLEQAYTEGDDHPLNVSVSQSGQAHTSPRAELLAIVIAIEQGRWPIHTFSDNLGFVTAVKKTPGC